jgi:hypothetical protein
MPLYDLLIVKTLQRSTNKLSGILLICASMGVISCGDQPAAAIEPAPTCGVEGTLNVEIFGGLRASLGWDSDDMVCEGMPRPDGEGARLRFAGTIEIDSKTRQLAFILGLPDLGPGEVRTELATNVTVIEEGTGRFFGTQGAQNCWTDIRTHEKLPASTVHRISGILYCVTSLAELNGNSSISFADLEFTGQLNWKTR